MPLNDGSLTTKQMKSKSKLLDKISVCSLQTDVMTLTAAV